MAEHTLPDIGTLNITPIRSRPLNSVSIQPGSLLTLPQEIRDHIYRYLLQAIHSRYTLAGGASRRDDHTKVGYSNFLGTSHSYRFHTNILAVNKQLYREASEVLYKDNTFIVVSSKCSSFDFMRHITDVPIVSGKLVCRFTQHSMRIHFAWKTPPFLRMCLHSGIDTRDLNENLQAFVMLIEDLPYLCRMFQFKYCLTPQNQVVVL